MDKNQVVNLSTPITDNELFHVDQHTVSGVGINTEPNIAPEENIALLEAINAQNAKQLETIEEEQRRQEDLRKQEYEKIVEERQAQLLAERARIEAEEREKILAEEAALEKEAEERKNSNILMSFFAKKTPADKKITEVPTENIAEEAHDVEQEPLNIPEASTPSEEIDYDFFNNETEPVDFSEEELQKELDEINDSVSEEPTIPESIEAPLIDTPVDIPEPVTVVSPDKQNSSNSNKEETDTTTKKEKKKKEKIKKPLFPTLFTSKKTNTDKASTSDAPNWKLLATHDKLTGLLNVNAFMDEKTKLSKNLSVILFDCIRLGVINDVYGYDKGNEVICNIAKALKGLSRGKVYYMDNGLFLVAEEFQSKEHMLSFLNFVQAKMKSLSSTDIVYMLHTGYGYAKEQDNFLQSYDVAVKQLSDQKELYKKEHSPNEDKDEDYDEKLSLPQRSLKRMIQNEHCPIDEDVFRQTLATMQQQADDILFVLMASPDFNSLFIFFDTENFLELVEDLSDCIDYSYLYAIYQGGALYYGSDEYYDQVTRLFQDISDSLRTTNITAQKIAKIKGINIFQHIFIAD